jgi:hypothetical protein
MKEIIELDHADILRALEKYACGLQGWEAAEATLTIHPAEQDGPRSSAARVEVKVTRVIHPQDPY